MNLNILSYLVFFPAMLAIAVWTARLCHRHGRVWMMRIFDGDAAYVDAVNQVLLVGCYTVNVGYVALVLAQWEPVLSWPQMIGILAHRIGIILLSLAGLHYTNITTLLAWSHFKHRSTNNTLP